MILFTDFNNYNYFSRLFIEVLNAFIIPEMQKIQDYTEKKICAVAMTRLLTQSEKILTDDYITVW